MATSESNQMAKLRTSADKLLSLRCCTLSQTVGFVLLKAKRDTMWLLLKLLFSMFNAGLR